MESSRSRASPTRRAPSRVAVGLALLVVVAALVLALRFFGGGAASAPATDAAAREVAERDGAEAVELRGNEEGAASAQESRLAQSAADVVGGEEASGALACYLRDGESQLVPLRAGDLVLRVGGALRVVPITEGVADLAGLAADATLEAVRGPIADGQVTDYVIEEAPEHPARGGRVVVTAASELVLEVLDLVTGAPLRALSVHERAPEAGAIDPWSDDDLHALPAGGVNTLASHAASPIHLPTAARSSHLWIESPSHGVRRFWVDRAAPRVVLRMAATGALEFTVPAEFAALAADASESTRGLNRGLAPGLYVRFEPFIGGQPLRLDASGPTRRGGLRPGRYALSIVHQGSASASAPLAGATVDVVAGEVTQVTFVRLEREERAAGALAVVVLAPDLTRASGARVLVVREGGFPARAWPHLVRLEARHFVAEGAGRYVARLDDVPAGTYHVGECMSRLRTVVSIDAGGVGEALLDLSSLLEFTFIVEGDCTDQSLQLTWKDDVQPAVFDHGWGQMDADGRVTVHVAPVPLVAELTCGSFRVTGEADPRAVRELVLRLPAPAERPPIATYRLELWHAGRRLDGGAWRWLRISDESGKRAVEAMSFPRTAGFGAETGTDFSVVDVELAPGRYTVGVPTADGRGKDVATFVADPSTPNVVVELDADAPLAFIVGG